MISKKVVLFLLFIAGELQLFAQEQESKQEIKADTALNLEEVVITSRQILGSKFMARNRAGSAYYVSPKEILKFGYTDINRMLKAVPGVNMYEEDGFGLRPNISLRGTKAERCERISIMEDGILAAPAPYSAPAAYYFPNAARMYAIEVLKGSSQIQYGPFTTGGAINMVSTPIPESFNIKATLSYGSYNTLKSHLTIGNSWKHFGFMTEYLRYSSDGFKKFENRRCKGFTRNDFIGKIMVRSDKSRPIGHLLELKFGYADELSDETYVGVTEEDFKKKPFLRYPGSQMDEMKNDHQQWVLTYRLNIPRKISVTANAYYNHFHRNWYKLNDVRAGISSKEKRSISDVLTDPETNHLYFDILTGKSDQPGEALLVRANNRTYYSKGIQAKIEYKVHTYKLYMDFELGLRLHHDEEDRFQWDDAYSMINKKMEIFREGIHGSNANRLISADAFAGYLLAKTQYGGWTLTGGLRYEDIDLLEKDYTKEDLDRTGKIRIETPNKARVVIPGIGLSYQVINELSLFTGVHKGFSPPSAVLNQKAESSINMELGARLSMDNLKAEAIGFCNKYSHMLGSDLAAAGGLGTLEQFSVGEALVKGVEMLVQYQPLSEKCPIQMPLQLSYTYTDTELKTSFSNKTWGNVREGDEIPYIFKHALNIQWGIEHRLFDVNITARYNSDMRTTPGQGKIAEREKIPAHFILDASANAYINKWLVLKVNAINLANKTYLTSRHPSGLRAGHPFGIYGGVSLQF